MIVLILFDEVDGRTRRKTGRQLVSHGIDINTFETIHLPAEPPSNMGWFNQNMQEWILKS